jgi:hypothetical protein
MIYFDSGMSKSTNTVVYFDWKTVIYIYVCGKCRTQFMLPMEKSVTFTGACANNIRPSINRSFVYKAKEGRHVRIKEKQRSTKHTHKTKDLVTRTPLKTESKLRCSGRVSSSCSTIGTRRVNLVTQLVISRE